jgi:1A family penicillin-binding protein
MSLFNFKFKKNPKHRSYGDVSEKPHKKTLKSIFSKAGVKKIFYYSAIGLAVCFIGGTIMVAIMSRDLPDPSKVADQQAQSTKIYDRTGKHLLYEVYQDQKRTWVDYSEISPFAIQATIAIEDKHFYEHSGVRIVSIIRAGFNNLIGRKAGSGGASTITQQLIKNAIVGGQRSLFRKIKEAVLAIRLEQKYSKEQILTLYLNRIGYGSTNYGIQAASQSYFKKDAKDLNLSESATLAAIIQSPSRYLKNQDILKQRRDLVLSLMLDQGYITKNEQEEAEKMDLNIDTNRGIFDAPHFVKYVQQQLEEQFGEQLVKTSGFKVITTLDYDKQKAAERIVKENGDKFATDYNASTAGLVAIDPKTGQILAMVGSRDYNNLEIKGNFNVVTDGNLQPGSSFKPFVYLAAFEKGYTPDTVLYDVSTNFELGGGRPFQPGNATGKEYGLITMRKALQGSLNIPAVKTMYLVGVKETLQFAERFGYSQIRDDAGLSFVIGGAELNFLQHANAYATLANNGTFNPSASILKIENDHGESIYDWKQDSHEVVKPELVATLTSVLTDNSARAFVFGSKNNLTLPNRPVAAKTGTTQNNFDAWTLGYTPSLATGVWVGNPTRIAMKKGGETLAGRIWNQFMQEALKDTPVEKFPSPPANDATKPVLKGSDGGIKLQINSLTGRIATSSTPSELIVEQTFLPPHDILYYVKRDDPRGPSPSNPSEDPQFSNWEASLQRWVLKQEEKGVQIVLSEPPTELDTGYSNELAPTLQFISPTENQTVSESSLHVQVNVSAPRGVFEVKYFLDGVSVGLTSNAPFDLVFPTQNLSRGVHVFKAVALDDMGNWKQQQVTFFFEPFVSSTPVTLTSPTSSP